MAEMTTITISLENYQWLNGLKRPGESFNDVLDRLRTGKIQSNIDRGQSGSKLPDDLDLPGSGEVLKRRREAIARMYGYLQDHGEAEKSDLLELIDPEEVGYSSADSFWSNAVKGRDSLTALPGVEPPPEGGRTWRYVEKEGFSIYERGGEGFSSLER